MVVESHLARQSTQFKGRSGSPILLNYSILFSTYANGQVTTFLLVSNGSVGICGFGWSLLGWIWIWIGLDGSAQNLFRIG